MQAGGLGRTVWWRRRCVVWASVLAAAGLASGAARWSGQRGAIAGERAAETPAAMLGADAKLELRQQFRDPPHAARPLVITHSGPLRARGMQAWLAARHAGGAVMDAGVKPGSKDRGKEPWDNPTYLNDEGQFAKLRKTVAQFTEAGFRIWIYDELGYPSASAGGRVLAAHPEYQVEVIGCRSWPVSGGATVQIVPQHERVEACYALPEHNSQLDMAKQVDLTEQARGGEFSWTAPEGSWVVCLCERFRPDTSRRHNIPRRNVNILRSDAVAYFLQLTHERYAQELGPQLASVDAFFTDEPQFGSAEHWGSGLPRCTPMIQWCDELPERFRQRYGYEIDSALPALFQSVGPSTARYRRDFYDVQSDLVAENYFGQIGRWCRDHGMASSGHMLLEESLLFHVMFSGSMLKNWERMDLPGVDLLGLTPYHTMGGWNGDLVPVPEDYSCKMASSVAHLTGKQGTFTESYALADRARLRQVLGVAAWQFAEGITHMSTYSIQQALSAEDYASFSDFAGRLAVVARRGQHVADVAVLVPESSVWATYTPPDGGLFGRYMQCNPEPIKIDRVFRDTCHALLRHQREFDCLSEKLLQSATVRGGKLHLADESFGTVIVPEMRMIEPATQEKLRELLEQGATVLFVGNASLSEPTTGRRSIGDGRHRGSAGGVSEAVAARTRGFPIPAVAVLDRRATSAALRWNGPDTVRVLHRREPGREIVLVANPSQAVAAGQLIVPSAGLASQWNPETGDITEIGKLSAAEATPLTIPGESARVVVIEGGDAGSDSGR